MLPTRRLALLVLVLLALAACDGGEDSVADDASPSPEETCSDVTQPKDLGNDHLGVGETFDAYSSNPPTSGPHSQNPTPAGTVYEQEQPVEELVHALEHGAVIIWTNDLSLKEQQEIEGVFNALVEDGYTSLIIVPYADMEAPVALTAWGQLQFCNQIDAQAIRDFVIDFYASGKEGFFACTGPAKSLPACKD